MTGNTIPRERLREGVVECPLCRRQIADPTECLHAFGGPDDPSTATADAVECPVCDGISFLRPPPDEVE